MEDLTLPLDRVERKDKFTHCDKKVISTIKEAAQIAKSLREDSNLIIDDNLCLSMLLNIRAKDEVDRKMDDMIARMARVEFGYNAIAKVLGDIIRASTLQRSQEEKNNNNHEG